MSPTNEHLTATKHHLERSLIAWGLGSVSVGGALIAEGRRRGSAGWVAAGQQHLIWGSIDLGIAAWGRRREGRSRGVDSPDVSESDVVAHSASLRRLLLVNVVLDLGYVAGGVTLLLVPGLVLRRWPERVATGRAVGSAVVLQGGFLLVLDSVTARRLRPQLTVRENSLDFLRPTS